jgi:hypothetical protein
MAQHFIVFQDLIKNCIATAWALILHDGFGKHELLIVSVLIDDGDKQSFACRRIEENTTLGAFSRSIRLFFQRAKLNSFD